MGVRAKKFTPEILLSAPRRSSAIPNHDGTLALYSVSTYSFEDHTSSKELRIMDIKTGHSTLFSNDKDAHDAKWLGDGSNAIIWLQSGDKSITNIMIGDGDNPNQDSYTADVVQASMSNLKLKRLEDGSIACVMSGLATPEGSMYNEDMIEKSPSTARVYDQYFVRFWDKYKTAQRNVLWYSKLAKFDGKYKLVAPLQNALYATSLECPFYYPLLDESNDFDVSTAGILFSGIDRDENPAIEGQGLFRIYFVPLSSFIETTDPDPLRITSGNYTGSTSNPRFSPCGLGAAFLVDAYDHSMDKRIMVTKNLWISPPHDVLRRRRDQPWDIVPSGIEWNQDGESLYVTADCCGKVSLFMLPLVPGERKLKRLTQNGAVAAFYPLGTNCEKLLISSSSLIDSSIYSITDCSEPENSIVVSSNSKNGLKFGLSEKQISEMYFEGAGGYCVQAYVIKPTFFDEHKKYPLAVIIHGGPQSAWNDAWSTRWNPVAWAEQGYVVVAPNITGSTGFGLEFSEEIDGEWGGRPYDDIVNCIEYVRRYMPFVDTENAVAAGGSYGGYMVNWIQGNRLGRQFKALVCHDGIFDTQNMLSSDMITGTNDFKGSMLPWQNHKNLQKWNPARPDLLAKWKTPMLVIHSDLDYRCDVSGGLASFAVLQASGIPSRYLTFPDENHWVLKPENSLVWHKTVFDWINKYSGITNGNRAEGSFDNRQYIVEV